MFERRDTYDDLPVNLGHWLLDYRKDGQAVGW